MQHSILKNSYARTSQLFKVAQRSFGAMDTVNMEMFEHKFTQDLEFRSSFDKLKCFRIMDEDGNIINKKYEKSIDDNTLQKMFRTMVMMNEADVVYNQAQRQSRISFYMTQLGEEAAGVGSAAAIKDVDMIFPQYREAGAFLWRGFSIQQMAHQLTSNVNDLGKGRQMPVHYGSKELNICTVSSPLCTQVPQASGAGYQYRIKGQDRIAITYFGEGAASEGDFHSALNFAATLRAQTMFFCRNNMYAISTPIDDQYAGDGIAVRGIAYGMPTIRVDGNDIFAIYNACKQAREIIISEKRPALVEAISYRVGDHSTSDFSQRYRDDKEMQKWKELLTKIKSPIDRFEKYLTRRGLVKAEDTTRFREEARTAVRESLKVAIEMRKPGIDELFNDVYDFIPAHIEEQRRELKDHLKIYGKEYDLEQYKDGEKYANS